jgi:hypothetical protein
MMSTRRSAASSSRTVTQLNNAATVPSSFQGSPPSARRAQHQPMISPSASGQGLTEASAYARAMASTLTRSESAQNTTVPSELANSTQEPPHRSDRPLPRPPGQPTEIVSAGSRGGDSSYRLGDASQPTFTEMAMHPASSLAGKPKSPPVKESANLHPTSTPSASNYQSSSSSPRRQARRSDTIGPVVPSEATPSHAPQSVEGFANGTVTRPAAPRRRPTVMQRPSGRLQLDFLLAHSAIQSSLLGAIGINTFLSLSGSSENVRRQFTGESVGRWVLGEWAVLSPDQGGNRWPNLTVWEGFCT